MSARAPAATRADRAAGPDRDGAGAERGPAGRLGGGMLRASAAPCPRLLAHLSTFRFEQPMIGAAKRLTSGRRVRLPA